LALYYLGAFLAAIALSLLFTRRIRDEATRRGLLDQPGIGRHLHVRPVPRFGGVSIFLSFAIVVGLAIGASKLSGLDPGFSIKTTFGIILPALVVFLLGLFDDRYSLGPYAKFGVQTISAIWLYAAGFGIQALAGYSQESALRIGIGLPLTIFWVLLITNAFNLIDGLDGLAAGSAFFSAAIIFVISLIRHTPLVSLFSVVLAGAILGFLRYNFHPASIFLGDSGSLFIGFLLSALALQGSQKASTALAVAIPVVAFGLPLLDVGLSVMRRFMNNKPLFQGDDDHVHHKLLKRGLSHRNAVLVLYSVAGGFGLLSLTLLHDDMRVGFVLLLVAGGVWIGVQQLRYVEFYEIAATVRLIWRRKVVTANNIRIRRVIDTLPNTSQGFSDLCRTLQELLDPAGFCGVALSFPRNMGMDESFFFPLRLGAVNRYFHYWAEIDRPAPEWELKLELSSAAGPKVADLYLFCERASNPILVDMNLLGGEFRTAIADAVGQVIWDGLAADGAGELLEGALTGNVTGGESYKRTSVFKLAANSASPRVDTHKVAAPNSQG
jgi:UDP-GlcNAc:undecaprenyl-phosphate/decaprenyl-phosphate GlcNAc-1-phosphate transferase